ncbi:proteinase [Lophium mytilinum]|uniref:Proteinase n=1 Tax=Lophium mytilinum TaxID=390894 RepID=A0A6A6RB39_9PEZI|nr:proteinase [Lophium mytilinum]
MRPETKSEHVTERQHRSPVIRGSFWKWRVTAATIFFSIFFMYQLQDVKFNRFGGDRISITSPTSFEPKVFFWKDIEPSSQIVYHNCYDGLQCARLEVPMDWNRTDGAGNKVAIAIVRVPAKVPVTDPRYGGPILINPGGPGGSGVARVLRVGRQLQKVVDSGVTPEEASYNSSDKYFDILGFDPRGINNTTPTISCFPNSFSRQSWITQADAEGMLGSSDASFNWNWRRARALAEGCSKQLAKPLYGNEPLGEHVNTAPVARDMVEIIERHAEWKEIEGKRAQQVLDQSTGFDPDHSIIARTTWNQGIEKLQYWGFSYGTLLGATFAAMYPDKVHRVVLDGVVDADSYYYGYWDSNLWDSDEIYTKFFEYCFEAGPDLCPFHDPRGSAAMRVIYETMLTNIWNNPLAIPGNEERGPEIITWTDIKIITKTALYQPLEYFYILAELLADLTKGDGSKFAIFKQGERTCSGCPLQECQEAGPYSRECMITGWDGVDASSAVLCTDGVYLGDIDEEGFKEYWQMLKNQSHAMGDYWARTRLSCVGWNNTAKWRYPGPFAGNTSHPILWISNTLDTVTPIRNGRKMRDMFPGSVLLEQNCQGHCSFTAPSICTAKAVRAYFQTGVLPPPNTLCEADVKPFFKDASASRTLEKSDIELLDALIVASKNSMD